MCPPQGVINRDTPLMAVPTAPHRQAPGSGHAGFDRVANVAALARGWFKAQGLPHSADAVVAMAALSLKAERDARDEAKRATWESENKIEPPGQSHPAPGNVRRAANPSAKKEPA